ncbi:hypothetical protein [Chitinibacter tainanensis]|uniref:hypothetical protein n=1 Tax=Chitinibacter tainanensis TaxID=230667 RepID=UPI00041CB1DD|nr:hypothetical protein [Chitinibacter tainanensis]
MFAWNSLQGDRETWQEAAARTFIVNNNDDLAFADMQTERFGKSVMEILAVTDNLQDRFGKAVGESLSVADQARPAARYVRALAETLGVTDAESSRIGLALAELLGVADALPIKRSGMAIREALAIVDTYIDNIAFRLSILESIGFAEICGKREARRGNSTFGISDSSVNRFGLNETEALNIAESDGLNFKKRLAESIAVLELASKYPRKPISESIAVIGGNDTLRYGKNASEQIAIAEQQGRSVRFTRTFAEVMQIIELGARRFGTNKQEAFAMLEEWRRKGNATVSDMLISDQLSEDQFMAILEDGFIPGLGGFRDFIPGEYEYQNATFRLAFTSNQGSLARVKKIETSVDVPDIIDRGTAVITNAGIGLYIAFNRVFMIKPEIVIRVQSATGVVIPEISNDDKFGFTLKLKNPSNGQYVTGTASWAAHGY